MRAFLDGFGAHWAFVELDPGKVMEREKAGQPNACLCTELVHAFFQDRKAELSKAHSVLDMSAETFFRLGAVMDWLGPHGAKMIQNALALDETIVDVVKKLRVEYEVNPSALDLRLPPVAFNPKQPATFAWNHLVRDLVKNAKGHPPKNGDGRDLCHAVVGAAYGSFATLDKHWKQRIPHATFEALITFSKTPPVCLPRPSSPEISTSSSDLD